MNLQSKAALRIAERREVMMPSIWSIAGKHRIHCPIQIEQHIASPFSSFGSYEQIDVAHWTCTEGAVDGARESPALEKQDFNPRAIERDQCLFEPLSENSHSMLAVDCKHGEEARYIGGERDCLEVT